MKKLFLLFWLLTSVELYAQERQNIWPEGKMPLKQPHQIAAMTDEVKRKDFNPEEHKIPYLEWFAAPNANQRNGGCMILISGGSYENCCDVGLIKQWRKVFTELGFQCVNFVYRTPRPKDLPIYQSAWVDAQRAVRLVRHEARKRGFDAEKIGVVAMSAGGHLGLLMGTSSQTQTYAPIDTIDSISCHINWGIIHAPAYGTTDAELGTPSTRQGYGTDVHLSQVFQFDERTPPMSLHHGGQDIYSPYTSTLVYRELRRRNIPAELHLFPDKGHGAWGLERGIEFMHQMGFIMPLAREERIIDRFADNNSRANYIKKDLWPEGQTPNFQPHQCKPYIEWHFPKELKTKAIQIICSGGAYKTNNTDGFEVAPIRRYLNEKGMTVVTLRYRTPRPLDGLSKHTTAWQDLQRAIRLVRQEALSHGLDPNRIGIMGGSAGGHLTLMGVTSSKHQAYWPIDNIDKMPCHVQWGIALYPAYVLSDGEDHHNTTGGNDDSAKIVPDFSFDLNTAPMLFIHGDADEWAAMNSVKAWEHMQQMGVQCELHTLATRPHCFQQSASPETGSYTFLERIWEFLTHKGLNQ